MRLLTVLAMACAGRPWSRSSAARRARRPVPPEADHESTITTSRSARAPRAISALLMEADSVLATWTATTASAPAAKRPSYVSWKVPGEAAAVVGKGEPGAGSFAQNSPALRSTPTLYVSGPKLVTSGTTAMPCASATWGGRSAAESVTIAGPAMGSLLPGISAGGPAPTPLSAGHPRDALEGHRHRAAAAEAERGESVAAVAPAQLIEQRRRDARPGRSDGVAQGDRSPVHVHLVPVEAELASVGQDLRREGLVDLDEVEGLERHLDPVQQFAHAGDGRQEEPPWRDLGLAVADDPGERRQPVLLDRPLARDHRGGGAGGDARGVARSHRAARLRSRSRDVRVRERGHGEGRAEACERLERGVAARGLVHGDHDRLALRSAHLDRNDLLLEAALVDGSDGATVALQGVAILVFAAA